MNSEHRGEGGGKVALKSEICLVVLSQTAAQYTHTHTHRV